MYPGKIDLQNRPAQRISRWKKNCMQGLRLELLYFSPHAVLCSPTFSNGGMMPERRRMWSILFGIAFALSTGLLVPEGHAQTVEVGTCKSGYPSYSSIQAAVNGAAAGALVYICPGVYPEQITIKKSLSLQGIQSGTGAASVIVPPATGLVQNATDPSPASANPPIAAQLFVQGPATVNLTNLIVDGGGNQLSGCMAPTLVGIYYQNASGTLKNLNVRNETLSPADASCSNGLGMYFEANTATSITLNISTVKNFQENGITANGYGNGSPGPVVSFWGDEVVGQATAAGTTQNGIQVAFGAAGKVASSIITDLVFQSTGGTSSLAATGLLIYASNAVTVLSNQIGNTQFGVAVASDPIYGTGDSNTVNSNIITAALFDGVSVCSDTNVVKNNQIYNSAEAGVRIDASCTEGLGGGSSGNGNSISNNAINGGCTGILHGTGTGNTYSANQIINAFSSMLPGNSCTPPPGMTTVTHGSPVPFR
jgi:hypothetical protein